MARSPKWDGKVPYDPKTGSVPHFPLYLYFDKNGNKVAEPRKENHVFHDILRNFRFARGRSAAYVVAESSHPGRQHIIFLTDFEDMILKIHDGAVMGMFTYCKRGQNFGTKLST